MDLLLSSIAKTIPSNYTVRGFEVTFEPEGIQEKDWEKNYWAIMTRVHLDKPKQVIKSHPLYELWNTILEGEKRCDTRLYEGETLMKSSMEASGSPQS